jgi:hypothetical protein
LRGQAEATLAVASAAQKSADIAEKSLFQLEAPYLYVKIIASGIRQTPGTDDQIIYDSIPTPRRWEVDLGGLRFVFGNYGHTAAQIRTHFEDFFVTPDLGTPPNPLNPGNIEARELPPGVFVMSNGDSREFQCLFNAQVLGEGNGRPQFADPMRRGVYFMGFVRYTDIFGNRYISGFCFIFHGAENRFALAGGRAYNYRHREDDAPAQDASDETPT